jgi:hypothetical protein
MFFVVGYSLLDSATITFWRRISMRNVFLFFALLILLLSGCSPSASKATPIISNPGDQKTPAAVSVSAYPVPVETQNVSYPAPEGSTDSSYPAPPVIQTQAPFDGEIVPFKIDQPVKAGMTKVTGTGPKGIPIILLDVTMSSEYIAATVIQENGSFVFEVPPLAAGHRIGITLGDLTNTKWNDTDFSDKGYFGSNAMLVPQIAFTMTR